MIARAMVRFEASGNHGHRYFFVDAERVCAVAERWGEGTSLMVDGGKWLAVREHPDLVMACLDDALAGLARRRAAAAHAVRDWP